MRIARVSPTRVPLILSPARLPIPPLSRCRFFQRRFRAPCAHVEIRNPNLEIRNQFEARMTEIQNRRPCMEAHGDVLNIRISYLGFVSDFDIRASDSGRVHSAHNAIRRRATHRPRRFPKVSAGRWARSPRTWPCRPCRRRSIRPPGPWARRAPGRRRTLHCICPAAGGAGYLRRIS